MNLFLHILIHILLGFLAGIISWQIYKKDLHAHWQVFLVFFSALASGVAVDLDHFIDYFLAFGFQFNFDYFLSGYQFLKSDKIYIFFHAWEYVVIFVILAVILRKILAKAIFFSLALGLFFHLSADCLLNEGMRQQAYSMVYRIKNNFDVESLVTVEHWQEHIKLKENVNFNQ